MAIKGSKAWNKGLKMDETFKQACREREAKKFPAKKCSIDICNKRGHNRGLCAMHYTRLMRHGDPTIVKPKGTPRGTLPQVQPPIGERSGYLVCVGFGEPQEVCSVDKGGKRRTYLATTWLCGCDCGGKTTLFPCDFRAHTSISCGCHNGNKLHSAVRDVLAWYKKGARNRGLEFSLTFEQFYDLSLQNCAYCGSAPSSITKTRFKYQKDKPDYVHNGIDRRDNTIGYTLENSVPCCTMCNRFKMNHSVDYFLAHCRKIVSHQEVRELEEIIGLGDIESPDKSYA